MVKKILKISLYILFFMFSLMYFTPKTNIYYFIEQELKPHGVIISKENVNDNFTNLNIDNLNVSYKEIESMLISNVRFNIFALYNNVTISDIKLANALSSFVPVNIKELNITYSIFDPLNIRAISNGDFGEAKAEFNIMEYKFHLDLKPSKKMLSSYKNTLTFLKKTENGEYAYDKSF